MTLVEALLLGVVQGLTEFLPVSSSGHLVLGQQLLGLKEPHLLFDVAVHVGTLVAVAVAFRDDLLSMLRGLLPGAAADRSGRVLLGLVVAGSVPTAAIGLALRDTFEALYASTLAVGVALLVTGVLLLLTVRAPATGRAAATMGVGRALVIGIAQGCAIVPGISRSGTTISVALLLGLDRELAARYSFLLSIPAILGALLLQLAHPGGLPRGQLPALLVGGGAAAITGYAALRLLLRVVRQGRMHWFAAYCWAVGLAAIGAALAGR